MLIERGLKPGECPERWNLEKPSVLEEIAGLYLEAGAQIISTNSFGGTPLRLAAFNLDDQTEAINQSAVQAVRLAVGDRAYVSASVGPTGRKLEPDGDTDPEAIAASFERQIQALIAAGIDLISVETMSDLTEASTAIKAARDLSPSIPICASMTFDLTEQGFCTSTGAPVPEAIDGLTEAGADLIGSNCGTGIKNMVNLAESFRQHTDMPLIIQSNAGLPQIVDGHLIYAESAEFMAEKSRRLIDLGVSIIGGCCGTTPDHIRALRREIDRAYRS
jgi:5-methyltetrahydrofolate--homocysteine methyltransferase